MKYKNSNREQPVYNNMSFNNSSRPIMSHQTNLFTYLVEILYREGVIAEEVDFLLKNKPKTSMYEQLMWTPSNSKRHNLISETLRAPLNDSLGKILKWDFDNQRSSCDMLLFRREEDINEDTYVYTMSVDSLGDLEFNIDILDYISPVLYTEKIETNSTNVHTQNFVADKTFYCKELREDWSDTVGWCFESVIKCEDTRKYITDFLNKFESAKKYIETMETFLDTLASEETGKKREELSEFLLDLCGFLKIKEVLKPKD